MIAVMARSLYIVAEENIKKTYHFKPVDLAFSQLCCLKFAFISIDISKSYGIKGVSKKCLAKCIYIAFPKTLVLEVAVVVITEWHVCG